MDPFFTPLLIAGGLNAGAAALGSLMRPRVPDFIAPVQAEGVNALRQVEQDQGRDLDRLEGDLAAAGATGFQGVGAREALARGGAEMEASIRANLIDQLARARMMTEQSKTDIHNANVDARRGALYNIASAGSSAALLGAFNAPTVDGPPVPSVPNVPLAGAQAPPLPNVQLQALSRAQLPDLQRILFEEANRQYLTGGQ